MKKENKPKFDYKSAFGKICETPPDGDNVFEKQAVQQKINLDKDGNKNGKR